MTIDWWHITTDEPGKIDFQAIADAYHAAHPNVTIKITVLENEAFKTKLSDDGPAADYPDLFQSWGGGVMAEQADAGLLKDITADVASLEGHDQPRRPGHLRLQGQAVRHAVGHGHDRRLVQQGPVPEGRHHAPRRRPGTSYLADVEKLKDAGIAPLAIAGKDKWPSMHLWTYLVLRNGGGDALTQMIQTGDWNTDACTKAGEDVLALNALNPYQAGYVGATTTPRPRPSATARPPWS